ncbi:hypothetical protein MMC18_000600 [Xylographa bjoerkii]|nr:hypothetical protein [Xylographa bjoerkii]
MNGYAGQALVAAKTIDVLEEARKFFAAQPIPTPPPWRWYATRMEDNQGSVEDIPFLMTTSELRLRYGKRVRDWKINQQGLEQNFTILPIPPINMFLHEREYEAMIWVACIARTMLRRRKPRHPQRIATPPPVGTDVIIRVRKIEDDDENLIGRVVAVQDHDLTMIVKRHNMGSGGFVMSDLVEYFTFGNPFQTHVALQSAMRGLVYGRLRANEIPRESWLKEILMGDKIATMKWQPPGIAISYQSGLIRTLNKEQ